MSKPQGAQSNPTVDLHGLSFTSNSWSVEGFPRVLGHNQTDLTFKGFLTSPPPLPRY